MAALPRLTELTLLYPHPYDTHVTKTGIPLDRDGIIRSATLEHLNACRVLPDFDTLQIVYFILGEPIFLCGGMRVSLPPTDQEKWALREQVKGVKDLAVDSLKKVKAGCWEGEGRKKTIMRVIELDPYLPPEGYRLDSVKVEVLEV